MARPLRPYPPPSPSSLVAPFSGGIFLELQKSSPSAISSRATKKKVFFFAASLNNVFKRAILPLTYAGMKILSNIPEDNFPLHVAARVGPGPSTMVEPDYLLYAMTGYLAPFFLHPVENTSRHSG